MVRTVENISERVHTAFDHLCGWRPVNWLIDNCEPDMSL